MLHRTHVKTGVAACALALAAFAPWPAAAQQVIKLTVISGNAPAFTPVGTTIDVFIPKVDEALARTKKYKIDWVKGFAGSVVKPRGELEGVQTGLGDVGMLPTVFWPDKLTLYQIGFHTPFVSKDLNVITDAMNHLLAKFPAMGRQVEKFNQIALKAGGLADNYVLFTKREVKRFADIKGMKIGAVGANQPWVAAAGAVPVATELPTQYNAMQTGIFEGLVQWQQAYAAYKMCEIGPFRLDTDFGGIAMSLLSVNKDTWAKLPDEVKTALREGADAWANETGRRVMAASAAGEARCVKDHNMKITKLSAEDRRAWAFALPNLAQNWAKREDAAGHPGSQMLKAWMDFMREKKQPIVRHWDRE